MNSDGEHDTPKTLKEIEILNVTSIASLVKEKKQIDICYKLARIIRNTDALHPSTSGPALGQLLIQLRALDGERYDREVITPKPFIITKELRERIKAEALQL